MSGKGDRPRDVDRKKFEESFDRIFRKKKPEPKREKQNEKD